MNSFKFSTNEIVTLLSSDNSIYFISKRFLFYPIKSIWHCLQK